METAQKETKISLIENSPQSIITTNREHYIKMQEAQRDFFAARGKVYEPVYPRNYVPKQSDKS